jgi:hypothetical protein
MIKQVNNHTVNSGILSTMPEYLQAMSAANRYKFIGLESKTNNLNSGELLRVSGPAIFLDRISGNGRKYIPQSVHSQVAELQLRVAARALFGELDHPPVTDLMRLAYVKGTEISHRIDKIWWVESEQCYYIEVTILDTPNGRILKTIHDSGSPLYVSLRSLLNPEMEVNKGSYKEAWIAALITIDFVTRPGFSDAVMTPIEVANESMLAVCESLNLFNLTIGNENKEIAKYGYSVYEKENEHGNYDTDNSDAE